MFDNNPPILVLPGVLSQEVIDEVIEIGQKYSEEDAVTTGVATRQNEIKESFLSMGFDAPDFSDINSVMDTLNEMQFDAEDPEESDKFLWRQNMVTSVNEMQDIRKCRRQEILLRYEPWLASMITHHCNEANLEWGFDTIAPRQAELLTYDEEGDKYDWHVDTQMIYDFHADPFGVAGVTRKISIIWQLSDGDEYEGGDFQMTNNFAETNILEGWEEDLRKKGTVVAFPSFMMHRITPVTSGSRRSMVSWTNGPVWR